MGDLIYLDRRTATLGIPGLGLVMLKAPSGAVDRALAPFYEDDAADPRAFVNALVSHLLQRPALSYDAVDALSEERRRALRAASASLIRFVDQDCAGIQPQRSDAELFRAMQARYTRLASSPPARQSNFGVPTVVDAVIRVRDQVNEAIHAAVRGVDLTIVARAFGEALQSQIRDWQARLRPLEEHPLRFIAMDMTVGAGLAVLLEPKAKLANRVSSVVLDGDAAFVRKVEAAVRVAPYLDVPQRADLLGGLEDLRDGEPTACRLLIGGVEGALWLWAEGTGVIDANRIMLQTSKPRRPYASSINWLFRPDGGLKLGHSYRALLDDGLFNAKGHAIRHATARDGHDEYAIWSLVALCGWLDRVSETQLVDELSERLDESVHEPLAA